jgi:peptide/nickel transport system permease protein
VAVADAITDALAVPAAVGHWRIAGRRLRRDRVAIASGIALVLLLLAVFPGAPVAEKALGHGPNEFFPYAVSTSLRPVGPLALVPDTPELGGDDPTPFRHASPPRGTKRTLLLLGADSQLGRDEFLRLLYGGRVSLEVALGAALLALLIGIALGSVAGFYGGLVDAVVSRFTDLVMAFPLLLLLILIGSQFDGLTHWTLHGVLNQGVLQLILVIGAFTWFYPARIVRTQVLSLRQTSSSRRPR